MRVNAGGIACRLDIGGKSWQDWFDSGARTSASAASGMAASPFQITCQPTPPGDQSPRPVGQAEHDAGGVGLKPRDPIGLSAVRMVDRHCSHPIAVEYEGVDFVQELSRRVHQLLGHGGGAGTAAATEAAAATSVEAGDTPRPPAAYTEGRYRRRERPHVRARVCHWACSSCSAIYASCYIYGCMAARAIRHGPKLNLPSSDRPNIRVKL